MNFQRFCLALTFSASSFICFSQKADSVRVEKIPFNLKFSYNSSLIYPGARLGFEFPIQRIDVTKFSKAGKKKNFIKDRLITSNLSWYHHKKFHDNLYLTAGWTMRRTNEQGFFTEFSPEIGLSRTFLGGTTYKVDNSGNLSIVKFAGYYYALVSVGGGIGYDFSKTKSKPFTVFSKLNLISMFPYNNTIYLRPAMEIGMICKLSGFRSLKVKVKILNK